MARLHLVLPKNLLTSIAPLLNIFLFSFSPLSFPPHAWFLPFCFQSPQVHPHCSRSRRKFGSPSIFVFRLSPMDLDHNPLWHEHAAQQLCKLEKPQ